MRPSPRFALLVAVAAVAAACGGSGEADTTSTTTSSTAPADSTTATDSPSTTPTTSTTVTSLPTGPLSPLNGLPVTDEDLLERRVIAVKVDNHPDSRPQSGLQEADAVVETLVEGGFTRCLALFHHSDSAYVGPVRSLRPTDSTILAPLGAPIVISGGQAWIQSVTVSRGIYMIGEGAGGLFRMSHRRAPHNLYADTEALRATADSRGYDDALEGPLYAVGDWDLPSAVAETITLDWGYGHTVTWRYEEGKYLRFEGTRAHDWVDRDGAGGQLAFDVLVVLAGSQYAAGPPPGTRGSAVPAINTVGSGTLLVFAEGKVMEGTWRRDDLAQPFLLFDADGNLALVPPGVPWVSVFPQGRPVAWS